jgi:hypothetical protein
VQSKNGREGEVVLEVGGRKLMKRLPVLDLGFPRQEAGEVGVELGRACFWEKASKKKRRKKKK